MNIFTRILGFLHYCLWLSTTLPFTIVTALLVIATPMPLVRRYPFFVRGHARRWGKFVILMTFSKVIVRGRENLLAEGAIIVSNHQSLFDIFLASGYYPMDFLFLAKKEIRKVPLIGAAMEKVGYLFIDRASPRKAAASLQVVIDKIKENNSVLIYPEGTRSEDADKLLPFKAGSIKAAKDGRLPILPVVVYGTQVIKPAKIYFFVRRHSLVISVLPAIMPDDERHPCNDGGGSEKEKLETLQLLIHEQHQAIKREINLKD